ncbi:MAG: class I SAM-dependent methyltransferase [Acetobacteraceae bacterium]
MMAPEAAPAAGPNAAQVEYWNQIAGPKWVGLAGAIDRRIARIHELLLAAADLRPGQSVLDVGCGPGTTTLASAERVGSAGRVLGVDISVPMLQEARRRIAELGLPNVAVIEADAEIHPLTSLGFDRVLSRFGVMFFADPVAAFRNLHRTLRTDGRLAFVCWARLADNPHWRVPIEIAEHALGRPAIGPERAPGPLALSDVTYLRGILERAGFARVAIATESVSLIGGTPEEEASLAFRMGPAARFIEERAPEEPVRDAIRQAIAEAFRPFAAAGGTLLPAAVHVATAAP